MIKTEFMELYEELSKINGETDLESIVNAVATEVEKYDENGSNQNCLFSTWAVELQLRGENFLPRPVYSPRDPIFDIKGEELVVEPEVLKISSKEDVETQVLEAGDGARFYCHINWADSKGGHEFLLINDNDTVLVVDGQAGYIKEIKKDKEYFDDINFANSYIVRFDNKEINQDILKYNDEDQIVEWDDELDPKLLEEGLSQIDYLPVSDVALFKEYADDILGGFGGMSDADIKSSIKEIHFEGKLAGYIGFSEYEENGSKCLGIGNFMIIERGKGLGSAVIQNIIEKYKNQYDLIYCFVDAKNDGAIRLYKKLGKVYDEDGPNDNGEYYVTFWDNGKWDLEEDFENNLELVFLSDKNMNGKTLTPRVPNNFLIKNGYEDSETPRVCFADSIDKALMAISRNLTGEELYVHQPKNINKKAIYKPTIKEVPDVKITGEIWYKEPVELECVGKILITADDGKDGHKYTYGDKTAELYGWNWEWLEN